jgi:hypothetical protein
MQTNYFMKVPHEFIILATLDQAEPNSEHICCAASLIMGRRGWHSNRGVGAPASSAGFVVGQFELSPRGVHVSQQDCASAMDSIVRSLGTRCHKYVREC